MGPGSLIGGKYRIKNRIGQGGMGVVWAGVHELTERDVAIKLIPRYAVSTGDLAMRLLREARAIGRISHRNVVEVLDVGETDDGDPFLVMPLLRGETLMGRLRRERKLDSREAIQIAAEVARGLAAAHTAGIVHRDLKPSNLMLHREVDSEDPVVKVLDFGISKIVTGEEGSISSIGLIGSPSYMSPEQIRGERIDARADLWSLGVILFEMLTGEKPFKGEPTVVMAQVLAAPIPHVTDLAPEVPSAIADVVARCLVRDPKQRIGSAADVAAALRLCATVSAGASLEETTLPIRKDGAGDGPPSAPAPEPITITGVLVEEDADEDAATVALDGSEAPTVAIRPGTSTRGTSDGWPLRVRRHFALAAFVGIGVGTLAALLLLVWLTSSNARPHPAPGASTASPAASP